MLSDAQIERYSRQIILPQVGGKGQEKLLHARVLVDSSTNSTLHVSVLHYLAAAGVGTIGIVARTPVPLCTALAPPTLVDPFSVLTRLNPDCSVILHAKDDAPSAQQLVRDYDLVLSDTDCLHDACWMTKRPFLYASIALEEAWLMPCRGYEIDSPCLRCASLPSSSSHHMTPLSEIVALFIGAHLATEAMKSILQLPCLARGVLLHFRVPMFQCVEEVVEKSSTCPTCSLLPADLP
jgi:molybdopterin-synthase adenylyltransferase